MRTPILSVICTGLIALSGCTRKPADTVQAADNVAATSTSVVSTITPPPVPPDSTNSAPATTPNTPAPVSTITVPAGSSIRVRLHESLDTKRNRVGDRLTATLDVPLVSGDRVVVPQGTVFNGVIVRSKDSGRWKGRAVMALRLDSFVLNGQAYTVDSSSTARVSAGHKKHDLAWIGGGASSGAAIGAVAGGGFGAAIGAGAGATAGTVGSVITGKRHVHLPVESGLRFTLREPVPVRS
jgi:hypothetical protein